MKTKLSIILLLLNLGLHATIHTVKQDGTGDFITIQEAINSNSVISMDTILVYPGTYYENLIFNKKCWLGSNYMITGEEQDITNTIIDGGQDGSVIRIIQGGANIREINGFTIQNGYREDGNGGGVYLKNAEKTKIKNCRIENNSCPNDDGGGIFVHSSDEVIIENCIFFNNHSHAGSAIFITSSDDIQCVDLTIVNNKAYVGTVFVGYESHVYFSDVSIHNNMANQGAGMFCGSNCICTFDEINRCSIYNNKGTLGSDFYLTNGAPLEQLVILDTLSVSNPDNSIAHSELYGIPTNLLTFEVLHAAFDPINQDLYVDPVIGDDNNMGTDPNLPLKTIGMAYKKIDSKDDHSNTIHLSSGTYSESSNGEFFPIPMRSNISLVGDSIDLPILDLENQAVFTIAFNPTNSFSLKNIKIANANGLYDPNYENFNSSLLFFLVNNFTVENVTIENSINGDQHTVSVCGCLNFIFDRLSIINSIGSHPIEIRRQFDMPFSGIIKNSRISGTLPYEFDEPDEFTFSYGGALKLDAELDDTIYSSLNIINSLFSQNKVDFSSENMWFPSTIFARGHMNLNILNSTIVDNYWNYTKNNYVVSTFIFGSDVNTNMYNNIVQNNLLEEIDNSGELNVSYSNISLDKIHNQGLINQYGVNVDTVSIFNDTSAYPYQLRWDSPLIDKGTPLYTDGMEPPYIKIIEEKNCLIGVYGDSVWLPAVDLAGNQRIINGCIDIGAYEYQNSTARIQKYYQKDLENLTVKVFPNPFKNNLFIDYEQKEKMEEFNLFVYDVNGYKIRDLGDGYILAEKGRMIWDGKDEWGEKMPPGNYFLYGIVEGRKVFSKKIVKK